MGYPMRYDHAARDHGRDRRDHADVRRRLVRPARRGRQRAVAVQRRTRPLGTPIMHVDGFVRGKGRFVETPYVPTEERSTRKFPLILTTGRILSQYNVGAQTRRTANVAWHPEDVLEIHPHDAEERGIRDGDEVTLASRVGETTLRAQIADRMPVGRRLHDVPPPGDRRQRGHDRALRLGDQLPRVQGDGRAGRAAASTRRACRRRGVEVSTDAYPASWWTDAGGHLPPVIRLANEIAVQFEHKPHDEAVEAIARHINSFWDPRMRRELIELAPQHRGDLEPVMADVIPRLQ